MIFRILKKDFLRKKIVTIVVFVFIMLSALLVSSGSNLIVELSNSLNSLFSISKVPHFVQMHSGELDQLKIDNWSASNSMVKEQQTVEMITIDGSDLYLGESQKPEENSIMDISFVTQNKSFDFLLDMNNNIINISAGEIAVPVYYMQQKNMKIGDKVSLSNKSSNIKFTISAFIRDAQMNPSIVHSKRFLVSNTDYQMIQTTFHEKEYLIEFLLHDLKMADDFSKSYLSSGLPGKGPSVDYNLFKVLNGLTDGIVSGVVIILSLLLMIIAILCLRFTILSSIEEDYREIGVLKAIGISRNDIRKIYLLKYAAMGALASLTGYIASLFLNHFFTSNMLMYIGNAPKIFIQQIIPMGAAGIISMIVFLSCVIILRRFNRITAIEALRSGNSGDSLKINRLLHLKNSRITPVNVFLGARDILQRFRMYALLCIVFFFCTSFTIIPVHFLNTIKSTAFISYMGIGRSDIRIDLRQSDNIAERFESMVARISGDSDVKRFSPKVTSRFIMINNEGAEENINIETGDFSLFPLDYLEGRAPETADEIALSYLNNREMNKKTGDKLMLIVDGKNKEMRICGIYQDVTNGGKTAKAALPFNKNAVLWYTVSLDLNTGINAAEKVREYSDSFYPARITDLEGYLKQTMGNTIEQIKKVTIVSVSVGLAVSVLITSLFLKMLIAGDSSQIAIMKSLGVSLHQIRIQYITRSLLLLTSGIILGTVFSNTAGQNIISMIWSFMGASQIRFIINTVQAYLILPLLLIISVTITSAISITGIKKSSISEIVAE
ncbi:MAG: ABC transporter permease [Spirochaetae bacterium HGW-Spirochaetae-5]|nr:MAG: ABC transporter permease [Spirochaetae bacterium HGW-Spirochaetae-5]